MICPFHCLTATFASQKASKLTSRAQLDPDETSSIILKHAYCDVGPGKMYAWFVASPEFEHPCFANSSRFFQCRFANREFVSNQRAIRDAHTDLGSGMFACINRKSPRVARLTCIVTFQLWSSQGNSALAETCQDRIESQSCSEFLEAHSPVATGKSPK